jgi:predicted RNase H-like HicB family nuclease
MKIRALVHEAEEGGFWAEVPALPGCVTQGETIAEVQANLSEAIQLWLEVGDDVPSNSAAQVLEVAV